MTNLSVALNEILEHHQITFTDSVIIEVADSIYSGNTVIEDINSYTLSYYMKGRHYQLNKQYVKLRFCLEMLKKNANQPIYCSYYYSLHALYIDMLICDNNFQEAMREFLALKEESDKNESKFGNAICVQKLGDLYFYQGYYPSALEQYLRNEDFYIENNIPFGFFNLHNAIGECYSQMDSISLAEEHFGLAERYALSDMQRDAITVSKLNSQLKHDTIFPQEKTIRQLQKSVNANILTMRERNNYFSLMSNFYLNKKDTALAILHLDSIKTPLRKYDLKHQLYAKIGDAKMAYDYSQCYAQRSHELLQKNNFELLAKYAGEYNNMRLLKARQELRLANLWLWIWMGIICFISIILCLTFYIYSRQKIEKKLRHDKERAEKAEYVKGLFLQNMSHEIRTPLNAIIGFNEVLNTEVGDTLPQEERDECLQIISSNSDLLITLIDDILDISKFESGTYKVKMGDTNISELCHNAIDSVRMRLKDAVSIQFVPSHEDFILRTDKHRLNQVISNLLTNACKHTQEGNVTLSYEVKEKHVIFSVTDTGKGIPEDQIDNIFNRFEMLDKSTNGLGLGLHICKIISHLLKARVYVDRDYKQGARFVFEHPIESFSV